MAEKIVIDVEAIDNASKPIGKIKDSLKDTNEELERSETASQNAFDSWTELSSAWNVVSGVLNSVIDGAKQAYNAFQEYAGSVRDLATISGTSAEEASTLLQVLDDFEISAEDVETAVKKMTKNGLVPTVDTLAKLADEYNAINDPMEKNQFILDNLGKSGLKWANALKQGGEALRANSEEVNKMLILTDEQIAKAERERLAMDALSDAWEGYKIKLGSIVGEMILANDTRTKAIHLLNQEGIAYHSGIENTQAYKDALQEVINLEELGTSDVAAARYQKMAESMQTVSQVATEQLLPAMSAVQAGISGTIGNAIDTYNQKLSDLQTKHDELELKLQTLNSTWGTTPDKILEVTNALRENEEAQTNASAAMGEAITKMIFQQASAGLDSQALLELARSMGVMDEQSYAAATATEALHQDFLSGKLSASEYASQVARLRDTINGLQDKHITITTTMVTLFKNTTSGGIPLVQGAGYAEGTGGWKQVPSGFPNDSYPIMLSSGEKFAVVPQGGGQTATDATMGGGGVSVSFQYAPMISLANETEAKSRLLPWIIQGVQEAQAQGKINVNR